MKVARWRSGVCAPVPAGDPKARLGAVPEAQAGRGSPGASSELPFLFLLAKRGGRAGQGPSFTNTLVSPGVQVGETRGDRLAAGAATLREQRGPQHPAAGNPEKPPSSEEEVFPPGNDLRDPRSAPGGPAALAKGL